MSTVNKAKSIQAPLCQNFNLNISYDKYLKAPIRIDVTHNLIGRMDESPRPLPQEASKQFDNLFRMNPKTPATYEMRLVVNYSPKLYKLTQCGGFYKLKYYLRRIKASIYTHAIKYSTRWVIYIQLGVAWVLKYDLTASGLFGLFS